MSGISAEAQVSSGRKKWKEPSAFKRSCGGRVRVRGGLLLAIIMGMVAWQ